MEAQIATGTAAKGTLVSVGSAVKAFVVAHPLGMSAAGGAVLAIISYRLLGKVFSGKKPPLAPAA